MDTTKPKRRGFQFSLRTLLVATAIAAILLAFVAERVRARQEKVRLKEVEMIEWAIAHPREWAPSGTLNQGQTIDEMRKRLSEVKR